VFSPASAVPETRLLAADGVAYGFLGSAVAIDGDLAAVGAYGDDDRGARSGSAYVFERSNGVWTQTAKLNAEDAEQGDYFGWSVAISGDRIVVGASRDDDAGAYSGSSYLFERESGGWCQTAKLTAGDAAASDGFGESVAIFGTNIVVGAYQDADCGQYSGSAYVFRKAGAGWVQSGKLVASDGAAGDRLGYSVALDGHDALCGAWYATRNLLTACGAAYVFDVSNVSNTVPVARDQTASLPAEGERYIDLDFSDPDGQAMTFRVVSPPTNGVLESYEDRNGTTGYAGRYYYSWDGVSRQDTFTWEVTDGQGTSTVATVTIQNRHAGVEDLVRLHGA